MRESTQEAMEAQPPVESSRPRITEARNDGARRKDREVERKAKTVQVSGVNLYYGDFQAVQDVSMTIAPNKVTALIGSSGCGKTTFLRSINRMHELTPGAWVEGEVKIDSEDVYDPAVDPVAVRRLVGMVFQSPNPFPTMSSARTCSPV